MTQELSLIELILDASILVQIVMLILVLASVTSWFLICSTRHVDAPNRR
jgi:biopolymer transport protein TolQ